MKYATVLLEHCSKDATQIFIDYYTGKFRPKKDAVVITNTTSSPSTGLATTATTAVQNLAALLPLPYMNTSSVQSPAASGQVTANQAQVVETNQDEPPADYKVPKPRTAFSAFVDHPTEFITFLEACIKEQDVSEADKVDLYTTLFEMYLQIAQGKKGTDKAEWEDKAKKLIEGKNVNTPLHSPSPLRLPTAQSSGTAFSNVIQIQVIDRYIQRPPPLRPLQISRRDHPCA